MSRIPISTRLRSMAATVVILGSCTGMCATAHAASARERSLFDFGWRFQLGDSPGGEAQNFDDSAWRPLDLPHDWSIEGPYDEKASAGGTGGYLPTGIGWYRKVFTVPEADRGRIVLIEFDGVYEHSTVWVNGKELGTRPYGYSSFHYDLTPYLNYGATRNVIAVRVDNSLQPNSRWYSGSGIYRHTWLLTADPVHIAPWGVLVRTPEVSAASATVTVTTRLQNARTADARVEVRTHILEGQPPPPPGVAPPSSSSAAVVTAETEGEISATLVLPAPRLWSPDSPSLYTVRTEVLVAGEVVDSVDTVFGIRSLTFDVDRGLLINEVPVKMKGMCIHHDAGALGAAVPDAVLERRLRLLQEMGCNAIRCSHNPMAPEFYDLCDRLGIMVMDESFDEWTLRKPQLKSGYSDVFADWYKRDVEDLIRRDRNHPSVMLWNAGNEIGEQTDPMGPAVLAKLIEIFHREDPTRPVTVAMDNVFNQSGPAATAFTDKLDIVGYNYVDRWGARRETQYSDDRTAYRNRRFIGTEETGVASTRGLYQFGSLLGDNDSDDVLILGHGPEGALYLAASIRAAALWRFAATRDYVIGEFTWTGFDYLGESKWPRKLTAFGALDTCGFKKDSFYFYQSIWTKAPMIHLLPHWNWPGREGSVVPVVAYTNCAAVELFLNGKSLGVKAHEFPSEGVTGAWNNFAEPKTEATTADLQLAWDVAYAPGELKAVGYDSHGNVVANASVRTAGKAARLEISADKAALKSGSRDVASVTVRALDADGNFVPLADNQVTFEISGPAKIIGVDNGDPLSHASYQGLTRALFNGMALAIAQSGDEPGGIHITARADGLQQAQLDLSSVRPL